MKRLCLLFAALLFLAPPSHAFTSHDLAKMPRQINRVYKEVSSAINHDAQARQQGLWCELPYKNKGLGHWPVGIQGFAQQDKDLYVLDYTNSVIHKYRMNGTTIPDYVGSSGKTSFGHQGLAIDKKHRLISTGENKQCIARARFSSGRDLVTEVIRIFPKSYSKSMSCTPALSPDGRWLVALSSNAQQQRVARIWEYHTLESTRDASHHYFREIMLPELGLEAQPVQGVFYDKGRLFIVAGKNQLSRTKVLYVYDEYGKLLRKVSNFDVGYEMAKKFDAVYEPEGLNTINAGGAYRLGICFVTGTLHRRHAFIYAIPERIYR
jgi:hypothetical protein